MSIVEDLQWRYAAKRMNGQKVTEESLNYILDAINLAPTSSGLQPFEVLIVRSEELKKQISPIAFGQPQVVECSHILIFAVWDDLPIEKVQERLEFTYTERNMPAEKAHGYLGRLQAIYATMDQEQKFKWNAHQAYIAMSFAMVAAAELRIDSSPMEGFVAKDLDTLLNLGESRLRSVLLLPIGYRDEEADWLLKLKKVRQPKENLFKYID